jgi:hypothetical protein
VADLAETARRIASISGVDNNPSIIRALQPNSSELKRIHEQFMDVYLHHNRKPQIIIFQEAKGMVGINYLKLNEKVKSYVCLATCLLTRL